MTTEQGSTDQITPLIQLNDLDIEGALAEIRAIPDFVSEEHRWLSEHNHLFKAMIDHDYAVSMPLGEKEATARMVGAVVGSYIVWKSTVINNHRDYNLIAANSRAWWRNGNAYIAPVVHSADQEEIAKLLDENVAEALQQGIRDDETRVVAANAIFLLIYPYLEVQKNNLNQPKLPRQAVV